MIHAEAVRTGVAEEAGNIVGTLPSGDIAVVGEDGFNDLDDPFVLKHTIVPAMVEETNLGNNCETGVFRPQLACWARTSRQCLHPIRNKFGDTSSSRHP